MRSKNAVKNVFVACTMYIITILLGFFLQKIFVMQLGKEYLGINGLFNNILSMLSVVELGFGSAITYNLYRPIAQNDKQAIKKLMNFYKIVYRVIAFLIFILGIAIMPFLSFFINDVTINGNIYILFFLALLDIVASYLLTYKRSILYADQKTYITNLVHLGYVVFLNVFEIIFLLISKSFVIYLILRIIFRVLENIIITIIANKRYPFIKKGLSDKLDNEIKNDILKKTKGLLFHKIGTALVLGTDNLIISKLFGVVVVGIYSNYNMIISAISSLLNQVFNSVTATIGNLLIENNKQKSYKTYKNILFFNSWSYCFTSACLLCLLQPFIKIWMGEDFLLTNVVVIVLTLNYYIQGMRRTSSSFKNAAGIFYEDRFVPLFESVINIVASIVFAKMFGLVGVFMGTIASSLVLFLYSFPVYVYKKIFNRSYMNFIKEHLQYLLLSIMCVGITYYVTILVSVSNLYLEIFIYLIICMIIPNLIYLLIFKSSQELKYYIDLFLKMKSKIIIKK